MAWNERYARARLDGTRIHIYIHTCTPVTRLTDNSLCLCTGGERFVKSIRYILIRARRKATLRIRRCSLDLVFAFTRLDSPPSWRPSLTCKCDIASIKSDIKAAKPRAIHSWISNYPYRKSLLVREELQFRKRRTRNISDERNTEKKVEKQQLVDLPPHIVI